MASNEEIIRAFLEAWSRLDPAELTSYFADDGIYHNMPMQPVQGRDNVEQLIRGFTATWTQTRWEIVSLLSKGDCVVAERIDHTVAGEKSVSLPCVGVFELENGKIKCWRDYFDLGTYAKALL